MDGKAEAAALARAKGALVSGAPFFVLSAKWHRLWVAYAQAEHAGTLATRAGTSCANALTASLAVR